MPPSASAVQQQRRCKSDKRIRLCRVYSLLQWYSKLLLSIWGIAFELDQRQSHLFDSLLLLLLGRDRELISCFNFFVYESGFSPLKSNENHPKIACASSPFFRSPSSMDEKKIHSAAEREFTVWSRSSIHCFPYLSLSFSLPLYFSPIAFSALGRRNLLWFSSTTMISGRICCGVPLRLPNMNSWTLPFVSLS